MAITPSYPTITIKGAKYASITQNKSGDLQNCYAPLHNLITDEGVSDFTTGKLKFSRYTPQDLLITDEYDGSTNIILNDDNNFPRLINTRISIQENNTFLIPEHFNNAVTNVYEENTLENRIGLFKLYNQIPALEFQGLGDGALSCGSYTFYFKLSDADGNVTNIVQHSGIVQVPIGQLGTYKVRMGLEDENAGKSVKFKLTNIDSGFDYVRVFYERTSSGSDQSPVTTYAMIDQNYPITSGQCEFTITGNEAQIPITLGDIKTEYADVATAKTQAVTQNILFLGNVSAYAQDYQTLQQLAWRIYPTAEEVNPVNGIDPEYLQETAGGYYDIKNVYNYVGYWPDEYYRFGVVFVYNNNQLSPVFNIQGYDMQKAKGIDDLEGVLFNPDNGKYEFQQYEPADYIFNDSIKSNSKGVVRLNTIKNASSASNPTLLNIKFHLRGIGKPTNSNDEITIEKIKNTLIGLNIKGLFFVRQKRIPTILAQGLVIGVTDKANGMLPIIKNNYGSWSSRGFLDKDRLLTKYGSEVTTTNVTTKGLLVPDAELQELTFNHIFTSQEFCLEKVSSVEFNTTQDSTYATNVTANSDVKQVKAKLTAVAKNTEVVTDGKNYFSTLAGNPAEPYKAVDLVYDWDNTVPQSLTLSTYLTRGQWGYYVGMSTTEFSYGDIVNIKTKGFADGPELQNDLEFQKRFTDYSQYSPISTRYNVDDITTEMSCYGGDCFNSVFTHKMMNNFADTELPTNTRIIDPKCWAKNYAVRATAYISSEDGLRCNCQRQNEGWYLENSEYQKSEDTRIPTFNNELAESFEFDVKNFRKDADTIALEIVGDNGKPTTVTRNTYEEDTIIGATYDTAVPTPKASFKNLYKVQPEPVKTGLKIIDSVIKFSSAEAHNFVKRGLSNINRSDVNAVSYAQWITFPICSSMNLALRDIDFSNITEENSFNRKRSFYPLEEMNPEVHLPESNCINYGAKKSICTNQQIAYKVVPYVKQEFFNRIYWSKPNVTQNFINSYRMIFDEQYQEYSKEYGSITKILPMGNYLIVVFQHGIGKLEVNRTPQSEQEKSPYLASKSVLPVDIQEITADYGSMWKDSVIQTPSGVIYGVDTVAKKIWRLAGTQLDFISDQKVGKFLNEFITLSEFDMNEYLGHLNVVTHYNEFKHDVMFTFKRDKPEYALSQATKEALAEPQINEINYLLNKNIDNSNCIWTPATDAASMQFSSNPNFELTIKDSDTILGTFPHVVRSGRVYYNNLDTGYKAEVNWTEGTVWSLCFNERMQQFTTFFDWYPVLSENINNIFFTFDQEQLDSVYENKSDDITIEVTTPENAEELIPNFSISKTIVDTAFNNKVPVYYTYGKKKIKLSNGDNINNGMLCFYSNDKEIKVDGKSQQYKYECGLEGEKYYFYALKFEGKVGTYILEGTTDPFYIVEPRVGYTSDSTPYSTKVTEGPFAYFDLRNSTKNAMQLWKHGYAGLYDNQDKIRPTNWYGKQHEFNFEFVVNEEPFHQKIFNNLKMLSNKAEPNKFEFEVVGEGYEWFDYKPIVEWINAQELPKDETDPDYWWKYVLGKTAVEIQKEHPDFPDFKKQGYWDNNWIGKDAKGNNLYEHRIITKLPYLKMKLTDKKGSPERPSYGNDFWTGLNPNNDGSSKYQYNTNEVCLIEDDQLNEQRVHSEQLGNDVKKYGRLRGNMQYLEDLWNVEIRPIKFKWCYSQDGQLKFETKETRHRDKYLKVKVRYSGEDLAIIQAITTMYEISYA